MPYTTQQTIGIRDLIPRYLNDAEGIAAGENANRQGAIGYMQGVFNERGGGYLGDADINRMYAGSADQAAKARMAAYRNVRQNLGGRGIGGGGYATGLGARVEMDRLGQLATARRGVQQFATQFNAEQGQRRLQGAGMIGGLMAQGPSTFSHDALGDVLGVRLTQEGIAAQERASQQASRDTRYAGDQQFLGGVIQGGMGLLSGLI